MNTIQKANIEILEQLSFVLNQFNNKSFQKPLKVLNEISIGQHTRHIIEFYQCLFIGLNGENINYDGRNRDLQLESDLPYAIDEIKNLISKLKQNLNNKMVSLNVIFENEEIIDVPSSFLRELTYLIEHTIHHLAIINIAIKSTFETIAVPENFGIAFSTINYQKTMAKSA
jgi:hypothetical protein